MAIKASASITLTRVNDADSIDIGGRNLIIGSATYTKDVSKGNTNLIDDSTTYNNCKAIKCNRPWVGAYVPLYDIAKRNNLVVGDICTIQIMFMTNKDMLRMDASFYRAASKSFVKYYQNIKANTWYKIAITFDIQEYVFQNPTESNNSRIEINTYDATILKPDGTPAYEFAPGHYYWLAAYKLEKGNRPSDWTPAPEDVEQNIKDEVASNKATITQEYSSAIEVAKKEINSRVSSITKVVDEHTQKVTNLTSELKQNNTSLQFVTSQVQEFNNSLSGLATKEEIAQMMTFENGILTINASNSEFSMQLSTSELGFYQGHNKVAWINNNELHNTNAIMTKGIAVGTETQRLDLKLEDDPTNGWSLM